jgi:hypothetical protein
MEGVAALVQVADGVHLLIYAGQFKTFEVYHGVGSLSDESVFSPLAWG